MDDTLRTEEQLLRLMRSLSVSGVEQISNLMLNELLGALGLAYRFKKYKEKMYLLLLLGFCSIPCRFHQYYFLFYFRI